MDNFQVRFPMPFGAQRGGMSNQNGSNSPQCNLQSGPTQGGMPLLNLQRSPGQWPGNQHRPHRAPNMIWSDPSFFQPRPPRGHPRLPPPSYGPRAFNQPSHQQGQGPPRGRGGGGGWRGRGRGFHHHRGGHHNRGNNGGGNRQGQDFSQKAKKNKKEKVDKRDLPENNKFHCEVCDRGFKTEEKYQEHVAEHQQCSVKGCRYVAAPKLVQLHYQTQHKTGLARHIWSLESPEEIEKWIQERKKNYPTKNNIARKQQVALDKQARGEVVETKQFGKFRGRDRRRGHNQGRGHQHHDSRDNCRQGQRSACDKQSDTSSHTTGQKRPHEGGGRSDIASSISKRPKQENETSAGNDRMDCEGPQNETSREIDNRDPLSLLIRDKEGSDDDSSSSSEDAGGKQQIKVGGGLASLISSYNTDDDTDNDDSGPPEECSATKLKESPSKTLSSNIENEGTERNYSQDLSRLSSQHQMEQSVSPRKSPEPAKSRSPPQHKQAAKRASLSEKSRGPNKRPVRCRFGRKPTLLERLLANEIRHERNVILQCVHHIVKNNFLGIYDRPK